MPSERRLAVIDLGSNSFRLVVFTATGDIRGEGFWRRTDEIYQPVRIAEGMSADGSLGAEPMARAIAALEVFAHFCQVGGFQPDEIDAVATSAIREASNREQFLERAKRASAPAIRVLSGEQEAHYGYLAAVNSTTLTDGHVLELGGGSMQLVAVGDRQSLGWGSWPVGAVTMTERFLADGAPCRSTRLQLLREYVRSQLQQWLEDSRQLPGAGPGLGKVDPQAASPGPRLVGIGGAVRNIADALQRSERLPVQGVQGALIERHALSELVGRLASLPARLRSRIAGIKSARADVILAAAVVIEATMDALGSSQMEVTEAGLREGIFFERNAGGSQSPLLPDLRHQSVLNLARRHQADALARTHSEHVAELALSMFDQLASLGLHDGLAVNRELLWAMSMLHDVGMSIGYDDHHKHSRYLILNAALPGYSPRELALIAQAVRYHRKDMPAAGSLRALLQAGDRELLDRCAVLLRMAEDLERSRDQIVQSVKLSLRDGAVLVELTGSGSLAVQRWALAREQALFERAFAHKLLIANGS